MQDGKRRSPGTLKALFRSEKEKLRGKSLSEKLEYVITYYGLWIAGILAAVFLAAWILWAQLIRVRGYWLYGMFANTSQSAGNGSELWQDFRAYAGYDTAEKRLEFNGASYFDPTVRDGTDNNYYQAFVALAESGDLDFLVMGKEALVQTGSSGRLLDLRSEGCEALLARYGDRILTCTPADEEAPQEQIPVGIDLSDSVLITKYHLYPEDCAIGISAYTQRLDAVETFLEFLSDSAEELRETENLQKMENLQEMENHGSESKNMLLGKETSWED